MAVRSKGNGYETYWRDPATRKQRGRFFRTRAEAEKEDRRVKRLLRTDREALVLEDAGAAAGCAFNDVWRRYEAAFGSSMHKRDRYMFRLALSKIGGDDVRLFSTASFVEINEWLKGKGWRTISVKRMFNIVGRLLRFAQDLGCISEVPKQCRMPFDKAREFVPPTEEELSAMYAAAHPHLKRVIVLGARFGMRVGPSEMFSLKWSDVDFGAWVIRLRSAKKARAVGMRTLPIPEAFRPLFERWRAEDEGVAEYVVNFQGKRIVRPTTAWIKMLRKAGIARRIRPYDLRHAFATTMLERGVDIGTVAKLMGHTTTMMITRHYQYVREERKLDALSRLGPIV